MKFHFGDKSGDAEFAGWRREIRRKGEIRAGELTRREGERERDLYVVCGWSWKVVVAVCRRVAEIGFLKDSSIPVYADRFGHLGYCR